MRNFSHGPSTVVYLLEYNLGLLVPQIAYSSFRILAPKVLGLQASRIN